MSTREMLGIFPGFLEGLTEVFAPGRPPGYSRGRPRDIRPQNLLSGCVVFLISDSLMLQAHFHKLSCENFCETTYSKSHLGGMESHLSLLRTLLLPEVGVVRLGHELQSSEGIRQLSLYISISLSLPHYHLRVFPFYLVFTLHLLLLLFRV